MCIDAKEAEKIADNAVLNQNALVINDIANRIFAAAKEGRYREILNFLIRYDFGGKLSRSI